MVKGAKLKILLVDDSLLARRFIMIYLKKMGLTNIIEAQNVREALEVLKRKKVGLIISDWNMPGMSGLDFLKTIRGNENLTRTPFIMVTAEGLKRYISEAIKAGVSGYIMKPYTYETLKEEIYSVFPKECSADS